MASSSIHGFGEPPKLIGEEDTDSAPVQEEQVTPSTVEKSAVAVDHFAEDTPTQDLVASPNLLLLETQENKRKFEKQLQRKQLIKARQTLMEIPTQDRSIRYEGYLDRYSLFDQVEKLEADNEALFRKDDSLNDSTKRTVNRLYREAQYNILEGDADLAKDLLVQVLFLDRRNYKAKKLLELGLDMPVGSYKVENVELKYWKLSSRHFYSGYPEKAVRDLKVLANFDPENSLIFERMGSNYYNMGETEEAIKAWNRALFLDPSKEKLKTFIKNAQEEQKRQSALAKSLVRDRSEDSEEKTAPKETRLMGAFKDENQAFDYAQKVREQNKNTEVLVVEGDDNKWEVRVVIAEKQDSKETK